MGLFSIFKKTQEPLAVSEMLSKLRVGDPISIKFLEPRLMGYQSIDDAFARFSPEDLKDYKLVGQVTNIRKDPVMGFYVVDFVSVKTNGFIRKQMIIETEILELNILK